MNYDYDNRTILSSDHMASLLNNPRQKYNWNEVNLFHGIIFLLINITESKMCHLRIHVDNHASRWRAETIFVLWHPSAMLCGVQIKWLHTHRKRENCSSEKIAIVSTCTSRAVWLLHNLTIAKYDKKTAFV